jgi:hypothetical protein
MLMAGLTLHAGICAGICRRKTTSNYSVIAGITTLVGQYGTFMGMATYAYAGGVRWRTFSMVGCFKCCIGIGCLGCHAVMTGCTAIGIWIWVRDRANAVVLGAAAVAALTTKPFLVVW